VGNSVYFARPGCWFIVTMGLRMWAGRVDPPRRVIYFAAQQLPLPFAQQAFPACAQQSVVAPQQSEQLAPQQDTQSSAQPGQPAHVATGLASQQLEQSTAHAGHPSQPSAQEGQGTAQQVTGLRAWAEPVDPDDSQPISPTSATATANSDLVAVMIQSPLLEWNAITSAVDGRRTGTINRLVGRRCRLTTEAVAGVEQKCLSSPPGRVLHLIGGELKGARNK
jgi:hypothetical protein